MVGINNILSTYYIDVQRASSGRFRTGGHGAERTARELKKSPQRTRTVLKFTPQASRRPAKVRPRQCPVRFATSTPEIDPLSGSLGPGGEVKPRTSARARMHAVRLRSGTPSERSGKSLRPQENSSGCAREDPIFSDRESPLPARRCPHTAAAVSSRKKDQFPRTGQEFA